jgi:preprotein translocase subunit YajC
MYEFLTNLPLLMAAPGAEGGSGSIVPTLVTFGLVFVIFYFLIIRPQNKKKKESENMLKSLKKGDKVVTIGGINGTIQKLSDDSVVLKVDSNTKITMSRSAISTVTEQSRPAKKAAPEPAEEAEDVDDAEVVEETPAEESSENSEADDKQ